MDGDQFTFSKLSLEKNKDHLKFLCAFFFEGLIINTFSSQNLTSFGPEPVLT